ncbi:MAG: hypothetical protein U5K55_05430 [Aliarcobacter sp.]|nr:hypothetical protein [Aliarcobacter sp.]
MITLIQNKSVRWFFLILISYYWISNVIDVFTSRYANDNQYGLNPKKTTLLDSDAILEVEKLTFLRNRGILVD